MHSRVVVNYTPIGGYRQRFTPNEDLSCPADGFRHHITFRCDPYKVLTGNLYQIYIKEFLSSVSLFIYD